MLSQEFEKLIYDYRAVLFLLMCLAGQIISWRMWLRLVASRAARGLVHTFFIIFNLGWFFTVGTLYFDSSMTDFTWTVVGRPSVSWQVAYLLVILPGAVFGSLALGVIRRFKKKPQLDFRIDDGRRSLMKTAGVLSCLGILGASGYGVYRQSRPPDIKRLTIDIPELPPELHNFRIAHITDIHMGLWSSQKELSRALALAAEEKPHLVAFTGDQVDRNPEFARLYHEPLKLLSSTPYGVWGVLGNHDHYTGSPLTVAKILTDGGLEMLMDRRVNIKGLPLSLIGLDDQGMHHSWLGTGSPSLNKDKDDPDALDFRLVQGPEPRPGDFVILLNHRPEGFAQAARHGCRLYLAGHTHGGQYQAPGLDQINLAAAFYKYSSGLYADHNAWLNVCPGLAAVGIPFRLFAWPRIDLITLRRKNYAA